jgi:hypothetical protein
MAYWLFQGKPKYYHIIDAIGDFQQMPWLVARYAKEMSVGDSVLILVVIFCGAGKLFVMCDGSKEWGRSRGGSQ